MTSLFAQAFFLAAEEPEGIELVLPDIPELIGGIIAFSLVFLMVWLWARPAISRTLAARQEAITGQLKSAEESKKEAESLLEDYKQQLAKAREEAAKIVEEARRSADALRQEMVTKAESEAEGIVRKAREDASAERERLAGALRDEVAALSLDLAQKVVSGSIDADAQRALLDRYIDELEDLRA
jgi:F-type H+-transporting ATPase subunit b